MIYYPVAIVKDDDMNNYAAVFHDVDGCLPTGNSIAETILEAQRLLEIHIATTLELGLPFSFSTSNLDEIKDHPDYADVIAWAMVAIDQNAFDKQIRFNVSWSEQLLKRVDAHIAKTHDTRSGFLAKLAQAHLQ